MNSKTSGNVIRACGTLIAGIAGIYLLMEIWNGIYYAEGEGPRAGALRPEFCYATLIMIVVGIPAILIATKEPLFGYAANSARKRGLLVVIAGFLINLLGVGIHYAMYLLQSSMEWLQFFVVVWYGIFVIGTAYMLAGIVMFVTGRNFEDAMHFGEK